MNIASRPLRAYPRGAFVASMLLVFVAVGCPSPESEWQKAAKANSLAAYEEFLQRHPDSARASEAQERIDQLQRTAEIESAFRAGTIAALERIVEKYPRDPGADRARVKLAELHFERTAEIDSLPAWREFLGRFPEGPSSEKAEERIRILIDERHPTFRDVKRVRAAIQERYGEASAVKLPFQDEIAALLSHAGVEITDEEADATLSIRASGEASGARYSQFGFGGGQYLYTGAYLSGTIELRAGENSLTERFEHRIPTPYSTTMGSAGPTSPNNAPFPAAFQASVPDAMRRLVLRAFGPSPLLTELATGGAKHPSATARILGRSATPPTDRLLRLLRSSNLSTRRWATEALGETQDVRVIEPLIVAARTDTGLATPVAQAIRKIGGRAVPSLLESLETSDPASRGSVIEALGLIGDSRALQPLIERADDSDADVRCRVAGALGHFASSSSVERLLDLLRDPTAKVRSCAADALAAGELSGRESGRQYVSDALRTSRDPSFVRVLLAALDPWPEGAVPARQQIVAAIHSVGRPAVPVLIEVLDGGTLPQRSAVVDVLGRMHGDDRVVVPLAAALKRSLAAGEHELASTTARVLGNLNDDRAVAALIDVLGSSDEHVRNEAIYALGRIGDPSAIPPLRKLKQTGRSGPAVDQALAMLGESELGGPG